MRKKLFLYGILSLLIISLTACKKEEEVYESKRTKEVNSVFNELQNENKGKDSTNIEEGQANKDIGETTDNTQTESPASNTINDPNVNNTNSVNQKDYVINGDYPVKSNMNLLQKTVPGAKVLYTAKSGDFVRVLEVYDDYLMVQYSGAKAFISKADFDKNVEL